LKKELRNDLKKKNLIGKMGGNGPYLLRVGIRKEEATERNTKMLEKKKKKGGDSRNEFP